MGGVLLGTIRSAKSSALKLEGQDLIEHRLQLKAVLGLEFLYLYSQPYIGNVDTYGDIPFAHQSCQAFYMW